MLPTRGKFFIYTDTRTPFGLSKEPLFEFLNDLIRENKSLIRNDYDVEFELRESPKIDAETFVPRIHHNARMSGASDDDDQPASPATEDVIRSIHLVISEEKPKSKKERDRGLNADINIYGYKNQSHWDTDFMAKSINLSPMPGLYQVFVTDSNKPKGYKFDRQDANSPKIRFLKASKHHPLADTVGPRLPNAEKHPESLFDAMKLISETADADGTTDPSLVQEVNNQQFKALPRLNLGSIDSFAKSMRELLLQIIFDQEIFKKDLKLTDLSVADRNRFTANLNDVTLKIAPRIKQELEKFAKEVAGVIMNKELVGYIFTLITHPEKLKKKPGKTTD